MTSQKEIVILKFDFEKTFDMSEYHVIIQILVHKRYGDRWMEWIQGFAKNVPWNVFPLPVEWVFKPRRFTVSSDMSASFRFSA